MIIYRREQGISLNKIETKSKDILFVKITMNSWVMKLILVYFSVSEKDRNKNIRNEIEKKLEENDGPLLIAGDFNGHVGFKGKQKLDSNGKMIIEWMEKYRLIMLNEDEKCKGEYTWSKDGKNSVIDYVLATESMYRKFLGMVIDEKKEEFDLSDHNLVSVNFKVKKIKKEYKGEWIERDYYKTDTDALNMFMKELEKLSKEEEITELEKRIKNTADKIVKKKYKRQLLTDDKRFEEPVWISDEVRREIKERKRMNRNRLNAKNKEEEERWKRMYFEQKYKTENSKGGNIET